MYVYSVYPAMSKSPKQLPDNKRNNCRSNCCQCCPLSRVRLWSVTIYNNYVSSQCIMTVLIERL